MIKRKKLNLYLNLSFLLALLFAGQNKVAKGAELLLPKEKPAIEIESIFMKAVPGKPTIYKGEPVTVSYLLYHRTPIIDPQHDFKVTFKDCFVEEFPLAETSRQERIRGKNYQVVTLKKYLIIPQQEGSVIIPSVSLTFKQNSPPDPNDFFGNERLVSTKITSQEKELQVFPLPDPQDSTFFSGAIGKLSFESGYLPDLKNPNMLTFKLKISGTGNLKNINFPNLALPAHISVFNEAGNGTHTLAKEDLKVAYEYSYQVTANYRGNYTFPVRRFTYFDPEEDKYTTYEIPAYTWQVTKGPLAPEVVARLEAEKARRALVLYSASSLRPGNDTIFNNACDFTTLLLAASGLFFIGGFLVAAKVRKREKDPLAYHSKRALKVALKDLRKLEKTETADPDHSSRQLIFILKKYLGAKSFLEPEQITLETLPEIFRCWDIPEPALRQVLSFLNHQYRLRFSGEKRYDYSPKKYREEFAHLLKTLEPLFHGKASV